MRTIVEFIIMAGTFGLAAPKQTEAKPYWARCLRTMRDINFVGRCSGRTAEPNRCRWTTNLPGQPARIAQPYGGFRRLLFSAGFSHRAHRFFTHQWSPIAYPPNTVRNLP